MKAPCVIEQCMCPFVFDVVACASVTCHTSQSTAPSKAGIVEAVALIANSSGFHDIKHKQNVIERYSRASPYAYSRTPVKDPPWHLNAGMPYLW